MWCADYSILFSMCTNDNEQHLTSGGLIYLAICFYFFCYSSTRDDSSYTIQWHVTMWSLIVNSFIDVYNTLFDNSDDLRLPNANRELAK